MKKFIYIYLLFSSFVIINAQQASDYFPNNCARWEYKVTPLDSLNNEIDSLYYFRHDMLFGEINIDGKLAKIVQTKSGPEETIRYQPYLDSMFFHFSGSNGEEYFKVGLIKHLFGFIDSLITDTTFSIVSFFNSLEQWYSVYRFAQNINDEYTILQLDTSIVIDTLTLPLRLEIIGKRLPDEIIPTPLGDLECKKFVRTIWLSYLLTIPPIPPIPIRILSFNDYIWIAEDYWIVQGMIPATDVDLSILGIDPFYIPGLKTKLDAFIPGTSGVVEAVTFPNEITIEQNYPNPFNPSTTINFSLPSSGYATLKIYNALGEQVAVLFDKELNTGSYEVGWNAVGLPSGVYFYRLQAGNFVETRKMILMK